MMKYLRALLLGLFLALFAPSMASAATDCEFRFGFKTLRDLIPAIVGECLENERYAANGNSEQQTTGGLMVWRKADNWTAFTDGYRTWINGPDGLVQRLNTERLEWEADYAPGGGVAIPTPTTTDLVLDTRTESDRNPMAGRFFSLSATVRNQGDRPSSAANLLFYRSTDATVTSDDTPVGSNFVSSLGPFGSSAKSVLTYAPSAPGTYFYGACVEPVPREPNITYNCAATVAVTVAPFDLGNIPWVSDGITGTEHEAIDIVHHLTTLHGAMAQRLAGAQWLADGISDDDLQVMRSLRSVSDERLDIAHQVTTVPDRSGRLVSYVLRSIQRLMEQHPDRLDQIAGQPWFKDGLTAAEAALIVPFHPTAESLELPQDVFNDLVADGYVFSDTVTLPLAGDVHLYAVSRSDFQLEFALAKMRMAVETMESFMGVPWPTPHFILLQELEYDLGGIGVGGWNAGTHTVVKRLRREVTYHEAAHYYFHFGPLWLVEGGANFLEHYTLRGGAATPQAQNEPIIDTACGPDVAANIQAWIESMPADFSCPYRLGLRYLNGMYRALGREVVLPALRGLYVKSRDTGSKITEDDIYQAFLTNTPPAQQEKFRYWYSCLHGRPIPGYTPPPRPASPPAEREALVALYHATNGPGWKDSENWLSNAPLDKWRGVRTDCDGTVLVLDLSENGLSGPIPPELANLSKLRTLFLFDNRLTGEIPSELGNLSNLNWLHLSENRLTGEIPSELGRLAYLSKLRLRDNRLTGEIPSELGNLSNLDSLDLSNNELTGEMPSELGNLSNLEYLSLGYNQLAGELPSELGGLNYLGSLHLSYNQLTGEIPSELGNLSNLKWLILSRNQLTGEIPSELGSLYFLHWLALSSNQLTGEIPLELGSLTNLHYLYLSRNQLTGCLPSVLRAVENNDLASVALPDCVQ